MLTKQFGFWQDVYLANTRNKLTELYFKNHQVARSEKQCLLEFWSTYEHLSQLLGDKWEPFIQWFNGATSPETITRCLRALKENGTIVLSPEKDRERQESEKAYRSFWGSEKGLRDEE